MSLADAHDRLREGDERAALRALIVAWQTTRQPRIADVIDTISDRFTDVTVDPGIALGRTTGHDHWNERFDAADAFDLAFVFERLRAGNDPTRGINGLVLTAERLGRLLERDPDPRATVHVMRFLQNESEAFSSRALIVACADKAAAVLAHQRDVRFTEAIAQLGSRPIELKPAAGRDCFTRAATELRSFEPRELSFDEWESLRRVEDFVARAPIHAGAPSVRDLYEAVWADPASDELRSVLADRLQEAGDPRGELIALQLARHGTKKRPTSREVALLEQHGWTWQGRLRHHRMKRTRFERGFLSEICFGGAPSTPAPEQEHPTNPFGIGTQPEWATVERLSLWPCAHLSTFGLLQSPRLVSLRDVADVGAEDFLALRPSEPLLWTSFSFDRPRTGRWNIDGVADRLLELPAAMPRLRSLTIPNGTLGESRLEDLLGGFEALRTLAIAAPPSQTVALFDLAVRAKLRHLHLLGAADLAFDIEHRGLTITFCPPMGVDPLAVALAALERATQLSLSRFEIAKPPRAKANGAAMSAPELPRHLQLYGGEIDLDPLWKRAAAMGLPCAIVPEVPVDWSLSPNAKA